MTNRSVSLALAGVLLCLLSVFLVGFFVGQRSSAQQFIDRVEQGIFSDHIYAAMCGLSGSAEQQNEPGSVDGGEAEAGEEAEQTQELLNGEAIIDADVVDVCSNELEGVSESYAQLIGFGTANAAESCARRLKRKGAPVFVKKRHSRSAKGRMVTWYQVVTEKFRDEKKLKALIARLKEEEKLQGIQIVSC